MIGGRARRVRVVPRGGAVTPMQTLVSTTSVGVPSPSEVTKVVTMSRIINVSALFSTDVGHNGTPPAPPAAPAPAIVTLAQAPAADPL